MMVDGLVQFHPSIENWFSDRLGSPTDVQRQSWPLIAAGGHVLITAPTGSGKTLTAFLWALDRFASGHWQAGHTRVLYVSPLKALNNDIQRNLLAPLGELRDHHDFPSITVQTRSGDTDSAARQRMLRRPPDVLITTPESLALLLTTSKGRHALTTVETVILDEVHALVDNRRGVQLMTSLERLVQIAGEFQRIALSATIRPLEDVARYIAGWTRDGEARSITTVRSRDAKTVALTVRFPEAARKAAENGQKIWDPLADSFRERIESNRSTLLFANSRRLAEKITLKINQGQVAPLAYAHHGSLSREIRTEVESRMKQGTLRAIVATSSLEMGIDVGSLDEVILVQSPGSIASTLQRVGRAGHRVGETSHGSLFPTHAQDFLEAAVLTRAVAERDIEPLTPLTNALDVLAQVVVSMCATETWAVDDVFGLLKCAAPYRRLSRAQFDLVIEMLAGRYAGSRVRELKSRLSYDRIRGTVRAQKSAVLALYNAGGVIPDRGYFKLRHADHGVVLGDLDEEFVWEATVGQTFTLGTQSWQINRITHNDVLVRPGPSGSAVPPFWRSETINRSYYFSERIGDYLELAESGLAAGQADRMQHELVARQGFEAAAAEELVDYLDRQRQESRAPLPHRHHLLMETIQSAPGGYRGPDAAQQLVLHTFWGGRVNRPWALALDAAWRQKFDTAPEIHADNDAVVIQSREDVTPDTILGLVTADNVEPLLREALEGSGFFGARFRECAGRALLLTRQRFNQRLPLWLSRLQAKKLMSATRSYGDFPVLLETWRTCLNDEFEVATLQGLLGELADGVIHWSHRIRPTPSPFAGAITFEQINRYMYADDSPEQRGRSGLADDLITEAVGDAAMRPRLKPEVVEAFERKRRREEPGYEPADDAEWLDWVRERVLLPETECGAAPAHEDLVWLTLDRRRWLVHREAIGALTDSGFAAGGTFDGSMPEVDDPRTALQLGLEVLSFYGPLTRARLKTLLPSIPDELGIDDDDPVAQLVKGQLLVDDEQTYFCDADNLEMLLRMQRAAARPEFGARPFNQLPAFLAQWQGFQAAALEPRGRQDALAACLQQLRGYRVSVHGWLTELPAARLPGFQDSDLDAALAEAELDWQGIGDETITLGYSEDMELLYSDPPLPEARDPEIDDAFKACFSDPGARYEFFQINDRYGRSITDLNALWWQWVWAGRLVADTLAPLRQGVLRNFQLTPAYAHNTQSSTLSRQASSHERRGRARGRARGVLAGWSGNWRLSEATPPPADVLEALEDDKDCARLLLDRYGVVCRELANREGGRLRWARLFKALRLMELSGEITAGYFFEGLSGPQFASPAAVAQLQQGVTPLPAFWINALDPAAPCGLGLHWPELPTRRAGNYLSFAAGELALVVENRGKRLQFMVPPDHPEFAEICEPLCHLTRQRKRLELLEINGEPARQSEYLSALGQIFRTVRDHKQINLEPR